MSALSVWGMVERQLAAVLFLAAMVTVVVVAIVVMHKQGGDADSRFVEVTHAKVRGTLELRRREADVRWHVVLDTSWNYGAVTRLTIMGPTGDNTTLADPGNPWIQLCGSPAAGCTQVARTLSGESQTNYVGGMQDALEEVRDGPHRFWFQLDSYNTTGLFYFPLQT